MSMNEGQEDHLASLELIAKNLPTAIERQTLGDALGEANNAMANAEPVMAQIEELVKIVPLLLPKMDRSSHSELKRFFQKTSSLGEQLARCETTDHLEEVIDDLRQLTRNFEYVDRDVQILWEKMVTSEFQVLEGIGAVLSDVPSTRNLGSRMLKAHENAKDVASKFDTFSRMSKRMGKLHENKSTLFSEMRDLTGNVEVDSFFEALASASATLLSVTPSVIEWLTEADALDRFEVKGTN
jgi:hypothetical protein